MISRSAPRQPAILLTGFEPFGGESINPSWLLAQSLAGQAVAGHAIHAVLLPTVFGESAAKLAHSVRQLKPSIVVALGQAGGRLAISFERVAINVDEASIADNAGQQPQNRAIAAHGPAAYWSTLPIHAMADACEAAGVAAAVSNTAGTFVCNHVFYALMHQLSKSRAKHKPIGGFVHVPYLPEQGAPSLSLERMRRGLLAALEIAALKSGGSKAPTSARTRGATH
jgi:pyroglutamyl-peptidase